MTGFAIYIGGALLFSLAGVLALGAAMEVEGRLRRVLVPALYVLILVNSCLSPFMYSRNLSVIDGFAAPSAAGRWFTRLVILTTLTVCAARMVAAAFSRENRGAGGGFLFVSFGLFFLANAVLSSALGSHPDFKHDQYYVPFLFAAVYASRTQDPATAIRFAKAGLFIFIAASCVAAVVAPEIAVERNYQSWIPGLTIRFWGLESHANSMAPLALVYLLLAIHQPFERRWLQRLGMALGVGVLLLAQSKTIWTAAAITLPLLLVMRSRRAWGPALFSLFALGVLGAFALLLLPLLGVSVGEVSESRQGHEAATLTGRDLLWSLAVQEWMRNPLFGYGITMWNDSYRMQVGLDHAVSAHNQFLQSLSVAGSIGLIGLLVYVGALLAYAISARRASRGLSLALFIVVFVRCVTETPLSVESFLSGAFMTHLLLFHVVLAYGHRVARVAPPATSLVAAGRAS